MIAQPFFNDAVGAVVDIAATTERNAIIYSLSLSNNNPDSAYLQIFFRPAASVILGTTVADYVVSLKSNDNVDGLGDFRDTPFPDGLGRLGSTGLSVAATDTAMGGGLSSISVGASYI